MATDMPHRRHPARLRHGCTQPRQTFTTGSHPTPPVVRRYGLDVLPEDVIAAWHLLDAGLADQARALLGAHLDRLDFLWATDDLVLVDASTLYTPLITGVRQLTVARYAHDAASRLHQRQHPRLLAATSTLATALHQARECDEAIRLRCHLTIDYDELGLHADALTSRAALADCMHTSGHCDEAINVIGPAWRLWRLRPDTHGGPGIGAAVLRVYLRVLNGCHRHTELATVLDQAHRTPLDADGQQNLPQTPADAEHIARHRLICVYRRHHIPHVEPRGDCW
jgi:hypothetical protein